MLNRLHNCQNPYQGNFPRVLVVCSAGLLRSPTVSWVLGQDPWNYNCRAAGVYDYALIPVDKVLLTWAEKILCLEKEHEVIIRAKLAEYAIDKNVGILAIPDSYAYRSPELISKIREVYPYVKYT